MDEEKEKSCNSTECPFNENNTCTNTFGCVGYNSNFLNFNMNIYGEENVFTTAALAPYPVGAISKKRKCNVAKHKSNSNTVECDEQNGHD